MAILMKDLTERRVPHFLLLYVGVSWGLVQFVDFLRDRYLLSPHLTDLSLLAPALLLPSVVLFSYNHGRPGKDDLTFTEKIGIPANVVVALAILFMAFFGKDLGAATTTVFVEDEDGNEVERVIPKSEFRKRLAIFNFDLEGGNPDAEWLQYGLTIAIAHDLAQEPFIDLRMPGLFKERLREAGFDELVGVPLALQREVSEELHREHFLSGTVSLEGDLITATVSLYGVKRAKLIKERTFSGTDPLAIADEITAQLKKDLEIPSGRADAAIDLPVAELLTSSPGAFRAYVEAMRAIHVSDDWAGAAVHLQEATEEDATFAEAQHSLFQVYIFSNQGQRGQAAIQAAMDHLYRLPERHRFIVKSDYHFSVGQDAGKAFAVLEMWSELYPDDLQARMALLQVQQLRDDKDGAIQTMTRILELDSGQSQMIRQIGNIYESQGELDSALDYYEEYAGLYPEDHMVVLDIGDVYRRKGQHTEARAQYERALLLQPTDVSTKQRIAITDRDLGDFDGAERQLEEALESARTAQERIQGLIGLAGYYDFQGRMSKSIEFGERAMEELETLQPRLIVLINRLLILDVYVRAGRPERALRLYDELSAELAPPYDVHAVRGALAIYLELGDADRAEEAVAGVENLIVTSGLEVLRPVAVKGRARIAEMRGEYESAIDGYQTQLALEPTESDIHTAIGRCQRKLGRLDTAESSILETLMVRPTDPEAHYELAMVYREMGREADARDHLEQALAAWADADEAFRPAARAKAALVETMLGGVDRT